MWRYYFIKFNNKRNYAEVKKKIYDWYTSTFMPLCCSGTGAGRHSYQKLNLWCYSRLYIPHCVWPSPKLYIRWMEMFGHSKRNNMSWWSDFSFRVFGWENLLDFAVPVITCFQLYLLVNRWWKLKLIVLRWN